MKPGYIYLYAGKTEAWTKDWKEEKNRESLCGRLLLLWGLLDQGCLKEMIQGPENPGKFFQDLSAVRRALGTLEGKLEKGPYGKPFLPDCPGLHFNISHSGGWCVCALAAMPCGVDIQERRDIRSGRMVERTMAPREQQQIQEAEDPVKEFIRLWTYKESCIKLSGEGLRQDMKTLKAPACHEFFWLEEDLIGCAAAEEAFALELYRISPR